VTFVNSFARRQRLLDIVAKPTNVDSNIISYPASLFLFQFRPQCNHSTCSGTDCLPPISLKSVQHSCEANFFWHGTEDGTDRRDRQGNSIIIIITNNKNNNNNNNQDSVYGAVIMAEPLREFTRFIWWMYGAKRPPTQDQTRRLRLWVRLYRLPETTPTIAIYYYYSAQKLILILPSHRG